MPSCLPRADACATIWKSPTASAPASSPTSCASGVSAEGDGLEKLAELVGLEDFLDQPAGYLSHGQTQWLEIALLVAQDADLILMDEPTAGMTAQETHARPPRSSAR